MNWKWDPKKWKRSTKVVLGIATIWPLIYMVLFFVGIFSFMVLMPFAQDRSSRDCGNIDPLQLVRKIQNNELKQLTMGRDEIVATDRVENCEYRTWVSNAQSRAEILREARALDENGQPRVPKIEETSGSDRTVSPVFPIGIAALFAAHFFTILVTIALMPLYIVLAVKNDGLDQTMRIIWVVLICMVGMFAIPVYWYLYVWREPRVNLPGDQSPSTA